MKQSYEEYRFSMTEILKYLVQGLLLCGAVDYSFLSESMADVSCIAGYGIFSEMEKERADP